MLLVLLVRLYFMSTPLHNFVVFQMLNGGQTLCRFLHFILSSQFLFSAFASLWFIMVDLSNYKMYNLVQISHSCLSYLGNVCLWKCNSMLHSCNSSVGSGLPRNAVDSSSSGHGNSWFFRHPEIYTVSSFFFCFSLVNLFFGFKLDCFWQTAC